jgi:hypothetical protein
MLGYLRDLLDLGRLLVGLLQLGEVLLFIPLAICPYHDANIGKSAEYN